MRETWKLAPKAVYLNRIKWIEIHRASTLARCGLRELRSMVAGEEVQSTEIDETLYVPESAVLRLREKAEYANPRPRDKLRYSYKGPPTGPTRIGPLSTARETQDVLPMSSGRAGKGWVGGKSD